MFNKKFLRRAEKYIGIDIYDIMIYFCRSYWASRTLRWVCSCYWFFLAALQPCPHVSCPVHPCRRRGSANFVLTFIVIQIRTLLARQPVRITWQLKASLNSILFSDCGMAVRQTRIVNGVDTEINEYPWQVINQVSFYVVCSSMHLCKALSYLTNVVTLSLLFILINYMQGRSGWCLFISYLLWWLPDKWQICADCSSLYSKVYKF